MIPLENYNDYVRKLIAGKNDFGTLYPEVASEWHPTLNGDKKPSDFFPGSGVQVWWKCSKCGHVWKASILPRKSGVGCPKCGREKAKETFKKNLLKRGGSFADQYPNLLSEWDYDLNTISPGEISYGYCKKVYWKCTKGHPSYADTITHRLSGRGCPVCSGHRILPGVNDLASHYPDLAKEWHPTKNGALTPDKIGLTSGKKIWWICKEGHEYDSLVQQRTSGQGCPFCSNHRVLAGYNDFESLYPEMAKEWHPTKNGNLLPSMVLAGSHTNRWWLCSQCGHEWEAAPKTRAAGSGCPKCASERQTSFPEQAIVFYLSKVTTAISRHKENGTEIDIFLPEYNVGIEYDGIWFHSTYRAAEKESKKNKKLSDAGLRLIRIKEIDKGNSHAFADRYYYRYSHGYRNLDSVLHFICKAIGIKGDLDIDIRRDQILINSRFLTISKENSLLNKKPELRAEWDYEKNGNLNPDSIAYTSSKEVWWKCPKGHSYMADAQHRYRGHGCPYCSGHRVMAGFNDLSTTNPDIAKLWDREKNDFGPEQVSRGSEKKVYWKCEKGHSWEAMVIQVVKSPRCPICTNRILLRGFNDLATISPGLAKEWDYDRNEGLTPEDVMISYNKKAWWICPKGHSYQALIYNRVKAKTGCPICAGKKPKD